nr:MAG TPA: hypothetical protein [Caudoviricetes sp.]
MILSFFCIKQIKLIFESCNNILQYRKVYRKRSLSSFSDFSSYLLF